MLYLFLFFHTHYTLYKMLVNSLCMSLCQLPFIFKISIKFFSPHSFARYISHESMKLLYYYDGECVCVCVCLKNNNNKNRFAIFRQAMALPVEINTCYFTFGFSPVQANFNYFSRNNFSYT